jgi:sugar phosphate isomerase/epimerase
MTDPMYPGVVEAIADVARHCDNLGIDFWFETGQETPVVLLRVIQEIGMDNLGINLDPANLILYGKGNPIDALAVFGQHVRNVHVKDGDPPTDGDHTGKQRRVGEGTVRFPEFMERLKEIGYDRELVIEREIPEGDEKDRDIVDTIELLKSWGATV